MVWIIIWGKKIGIIFLLHLFDRYFFCSWVNVHFIDVWNISNVSIFSLMKWNGGSHYFRICVRKRVEFRTLTITRNECSLSTINCWILLSIAILKKNLIIERNSCIKFVKTKIEEIQNKHDVLNKSLDFFLWRSRKLNSYAI